MHAHRIEVLNGTDNDAVIILIPHHFHFILFPANQRLINQQLISRREVQASLTDLHKLFAIVGNPTATAAKRKGRADNRREANPGQNIQRFVQGMCNFSARCLKTNPRHRLTK